MKSRNLNWKFILLNSIAAIVLILGFRQLIFLFNARLVEGLLKYNSDLNLFGDFVLKSNTGPISEVLINFLIGLSLAGLIATITAVMISWLIARRESISKINVIILFIVSLVAELLINKFSIDFHDLIPSLLGVIDMVGVRTVYIINVSILMLLASQLYLNKKLKKHFYQQGA
jgi:hypothetical protein